MDCKDLMVGDWFKVVDYNSPFRITAIYDDVVQTQADYQSEIDGNWYSEAEIKDLVPIELTEEILAKNGYKSTQGLDFYWLDDKKHCCMKNYDGKRLFCYKQGVNDVWLLVKYVHQLQHLLRLCGIEKEIEL